MRAPARRVQWIMEKGRTTLAAKGTNMKKRFKDRREAGLALANRIELRGLDNPVVLALPRGGLPVGAEVARALGAPLDVLVVRKLGFPVQPELAMGAVASGGILVMNPEVMESAGLSEEAIRPVLEEEPRELARRERVYRGSRAPVDVGGRIAIVVDDGVATGSSMLAAIRSLRPRGAARIIAAVPVAPAETIERLEAEADAVVCLAAPEPFYAISVWYESFPQLTDDEVRTILDAEDTRAADSRKNG